VGWKDVRFTLSGGVPFQCDCEAVHVLEDQFKLALGKAFCTQEPMSW